MNVKIKYDANGFGEAEVVVDTRDIQDEKGRESYKNLHTFLSDILGDSPSVDADCQMKNRTKTKQHNKSIPHYKADRRLAKIIIDKGGLKYLHGVNYIDKKQVFFFDKVRMVQDIVEQYNAQSDGDVPITKTKKPKEKKAKSHVEDAVDKPAEISSDEIKLSSGGIVK